MKVFNFCSLSFLASSSLS